MAQARRWWFTLEVLTGSKGGFDSDQGSLRPISRRRMSLSGAGIADDHQTLVLVEQDAAEPPISLAGGHHRTRPRSWYTNLISDTIGLSMAAAVGLLVLAIGSNNVDYRLSAFWENFSREILFVPMILVAFLAYGLYHRSERRIFRNPTADLKDLAQATAAGGFLALAVESLLHRVSGMRPLTLTQLVVLGCVAVLTVPMAGAGMTSFLRRHYGPVRVIIVGTGMIADGVATRLRAGRDVEVVGFVDDDARDPSKALGRLGDLPALCQRFQVERVLVTFSRTHPERVLRLLRPLHGQVAISIVPRYFELLSWRSQIDDVSGMPMIDVAPPHLGVLSRTIKRTFDLAIAFLVLVLSSPIWIVSAVLVRLTDGGPVLFKQIRRGRAGQGFVLYKLRTMRQGAEAERAALLSQSTGSGPLFKMDDDPRVTRVGRFLRRTSIDEIPQLINVIRGDMSLVGPRPFIPEESDQIGGWAARRYEVRPGLTGLWQISGRSDLEHSELCRLDYLYVASWSLWWDIRILLQTPLSVLRRRGAY